MKRFLYLFMLLLVAVLFVPANVAHAAPSLDRTVRKGQELDEDLVVVGGRLVVEEGAQVNGAITVYGGVADLAGFIKGDVSIFGGRAILSGDVDGDLVIIGGNLSAGATASVDGDCILIGGSVNGDGAEQINCAAVGDLPLLAAPNAVRSIRLLDRSSTSVFSRMANAASLSLTLGLAALFIGSLAPSHLSRVSKAISSKPAVTSTVGFLTGVAGVSLAILLAIISGILVIVCIGLLGFPVVLGLFALLIGGWIAGWIAAGQLLGEHLVKLLKLSNRTMPVTAALGTVALTLAAALLSSLPFYLGGWLWSLAALGLGFAGLGAVALTRFGTVAYPPPGLAPVQKSPVLAQDVPSTETSASENELSQE